MSTLIEEAPPIINQITAPDGWTINGKEVVCLGDLTTHGGRVITATGITIYNGLRIARVGDKVSCPRCEGEHVIVEGALIYKENDKCVATHGNAVSCGARLVANTAKDESIGNRYFIVVDVNDKPIHEAEYVIIDEGNTEYRGITDENGHTETIYGKLGKKISIRIVSTPSSRGEYQKVTD